MNSNKKNNLSLSDFVLDIRDLYCKTGNKRIEGFFIKLSQVNDQELFQWLRSNRNIKGKLRDPDVYEALIVLISIRSEFPLVPTENNPAPTPFEKEDVVKKVMGAPSVSKRTPYFLAFYTLVNDPRVSGILKPFEDILRVYHETLSQQRNPLSSNDVIDDLYAISVEYGNRGTEVIEKTPKRVEKPFVIKELKETRKQKKQSMYNYLRDRFTSETSSAALRSKFVDLSNKISSEMMLVTPIALMGYLRIAPTADMVNEAKSIARDVLKNLGDENKVINYEMIKNRAMRKSGLLSPNQLLNFYNKKEQYDVEKLTGKTPDYPNVSLQDSQWVNPRFLSLVGYVLIILKNESERG